MEPGYDLARIVEVKQIAMSLHLLAGAACKLGQLELPKEKESRRRIHNSRSLRAPRRIYRFWLEVFAVCLSADLHSSPSWSYFVPWHG